MSPVVVVQSESSWAVDNPLYDTVPTQATHQVEEAASEISDSVAYCGRFPGQADWELESQERHHSPHSYIIPCYAGEQWGEWDGHR